MGQIPRLELGGKYKFSVFLPEEIKTVKVEIEAKSFERVEADGKDENAFKCESNIGMIFYISQNSGRVLKISIPNHIIIFLILHYHFKNCCGIMVLTFLSICNPADIFPRLKF